MAAPLRLAVVILTWNAREDTLACLDSVCGQLSAADAVYVADNGSEDGTEKVVRAGFPDVRYVQNGANLGFAGGNNTALRRALDDGYPWVLILNNDTLVPKGVLDALLAAAKTYPDAGSIQPLLVRANDPAIIDSAGHVLSAFPGVRDALLGRPTREAPEDGAEIFGACGAAALVRADVLREVGLFDERLFVLCEDVDLAFRVRLGGHTVRLVSSARVHHKRGVSGGGSGESARLRKLWLQRNLIALALRYWPTSALVLGSPILLFRALHALRLASGRPAHSCGPLWSAASRERAANRRRMKQLGQDRWFGA